jgi:hypothetical protein
MREKIYGPVDRGPYISAFQRIKNYFFAGFSGTEAGAGALAGAGATVGVAVDVGAVVGFGASAFFSHPSREIPRIRTKARITTIVFLVIVRLLFCFNKCGLSPKQKNRRTMLANGGFLRVIFNQRILVATDRVTVSSLTCWPSFSARSSC